MPNQYAATQLDDVFRALADPTRRAVVHRLSMGPASVTELSRPFDMALPSFVQHLKVLEGSGLIRSQKIGRVRTCQIVPEQLTAAEAWIEELKVYWAERLDALAAYVEETDERTRGERDDNV